MSVFVPSMPPGRGVRWLLSNPWGGIRSHLPMLIGIPRDDEDPEPSSQWGPDPSGMFDVLCLMLVYPPQGYGWLSPTAGALEFSQCLTRALTTSARKTLVQMQKVCQAPSKGQPYQIKLYLL